MIFALHKRYLQTFANLDFEVVFNSTVMKKSCLVLPMLLFINFMVSQSVFQVNGFAIAAPSQERVSDFVSFIDTTLAINGINTLILRVDYNYAYTSRPELRGKNPLTKESVKKIVAVCKKNNIELIPQVNLLGHQSWASKIGKLLEVYPEFDETPLVKLPKEYKWPNSDGLYCKSYCPKHPEVHKVVFDIVDEIMEVFEAKAFHAGMDEVFYLADANCPRCKGMDPASLFAAEIRTISNHLEKNNARLWIWGDRLINGATTGIGMWEASMNNTAKAVALIPKSVVICDWHYNKALPIPVYFAMNDLDVIACSWNKPEVAKDQVKMMHSLKINSSKKMQKHYLGVMHTVWSSADKFMDTYNDTVENSKKGSQAACFKAMVKAVNELEKSSERF